jgi:hypothetical protein
MKMVAEVIASAFASRFSWGGDAAGKRVYCASHDIKGGQIMSAFEEFLRDNPKMADGPYGAAMAGTLSKSFPCGAQWASRKQPCPQSRSKRFWNAAIWGLPAEQFDFIALVLNYPSGLRTWILPRSVANETALNPKGSSSGKFTKRELQVKSIEKRFPTYENNFRLDGDDAPLRSWSRGPHRDQPCRLRRDLRHVPARQRGCQG